MHQVTVLDTSVATLNIGDEIIMDSVRREVAELLPEAMIRTVPTHERLGKRSRMLLRQSSVNLAGGTNLVGPPMAYNRLWKVGVGELLRSPRVTLMGSGWRRYDARVTPYTAALLRRALSESVPHAVRDEFTADKLKSIGVRNTLVTGCPTTWLLTEDVVRRLPRSIGSAAVVVLNGKKDPAGFASAVFQSALSHYEKVYFWPQMIPDMRYLTELPRGIEPISPTLRGYDSLLRSGPGLDYVGSRLHAGIRALQHGRRTLIFELDNRATEMGKTLKLPTYPTSTSLTELSDLVTSPVEYRITIPADAVSAWKASVREAALAA